MTAKIQEAKLDYSFNNTPNTNNQLFTDVTDTLGIRYQQKEFDFPDFNIQKLLPHKLSEYGPGIATGDIDGNGLEDMVCGGSFGYSSSILMQQKDGRFTVKDLIPKATPQTKPTEDLGL